MAIEAPRTRRPAHQADRGPEVHHRQRPLPRRHHARWAHPHRDPAQPVRAREHPLDRHLAAKAMPGVVAVFTGADIPYNPLPFAWPAGGSAGIQNNVNMPSVLATDSVKWTGEGVAAVVAETPARRRTRSRRSRSTTSRCRPSSTSRRPWRPARRSSMRTPRTTWCSSGRSATRTAPNRPSPRPR